jgi:hypothetical protein
MVELMNLNFVDKSEKWLDFTRKLSVIKKSYVEIGFQGDALEKTRSGGVSKSTVVEVAIGTKPAVIPKDVTLPVPAPSVDISTPSIVIPGSTVKLPVKVWEPSTNNISFPSNPSTWSTFRLPTQAPEPIINGGVPPPTVLLNCVAVI